MFKDIENYFSSEEERNSELVTSVFDGLLAAYKNHKKLGEIGKAKDRKNRFGDMALRADVEAEEFVLASIKKFADESNTRIICKSEELGENEINPNGKEVLFGVFDGLDGSGNYLKNAKFGYGTMVAIADKADPKYGDFIIAGEVMMEEGKIVLAIKNKGVFVFDIENNQFEKLPQFDKGEKFDDAKTLSNKHFPEELSAYGDKSWLMTGSTAWSIFSICSDDKFNGLIEVTRKGNLEQPILYLMISQLGGVMVDKTGQSIEDRVFNTWGQTRDGQEFLVTAKNLEVAREILNRLN